MIYKSIYTIDKKEQKIMNKIIGVYAAHRESRKNYYLNDGEDAHKNKTNDIMYQNKINELYAEKRKYLNAQANIE